jgi:hypothetical protein
MVRWKNMAAAVGMAALLVLIGLPSWAQQQVVGTVEALQGRVTVEAGGSRQSLGTGAVIRLGDVIETAADAKLAVRFNDGTSLNLGPAARFAVDQFAFDPAARKGEFVGRALQGGFFFVGGRTEAQPNAKVEIRSPHALLGVRGTAFFAGPIDGEYGVFVREGRVLVTAGGESLPLAAGEGTMIKAPGDKPQPKRVWGQPKIDRALTSVGAR